MKFDKTNLKAMREDFQLAMKDFEKKYNVSVVMGNISYSELEFHAKVTVTSKEKNSEDNERAEFERNCRMYGLTKEDYGRIIQHKGKNYTLIGFENSRPKFCIRARGVDGKEILFSELAIAKFQKSGLTEGKCGF